MTVSISQMGCKRVKITTNGNEASVNIGLNLGFRALLDILRRQEGSENNGMFTEVSSFSAAYFNCGNHSIKVSSHPGQGGDNYIGGESGKCSSSHGIHIGEDRVQLS